MESEKISAEEWASWVRPSDALAEVTQILRSESAAKSTLMSRLQGGALRAMAKSRAWDSDGPSDEFRLIELRFWSAVSNKTSWWVSGDVDVSMVIKGYAGTIGRISHGHFYGVRLSPDGMTQIYLEAGKSSNLGFQPNLMQGGSTKIDPQAATSGSIVASDVVKRPISPQHMAAWWSFYQAVTEAAKDTEPYALDHFGRCFPGHKVQRQKIRDLRGEKKSGPKSKTAE